MKKEMIRIDGVGILIKKLDRLIELLDRNNFLTSMVEKKLDKIIERFK